MKKTIGILGAGQLSKMLALAGIPMGIDFIFMDPGEGESVKSLGAHYRQDYTDKPALAAFAAKCDVITYENENIPLEAIQSLLDQSAVVHPPLAAIRAMQDRLLERQFLEECGIPIAPYIAADSAEALLSAAQNFTFPALIKHRRLSYDGKGQVRLQSLSDLQEALETLNAKDIIVEGMIDFDREVSLLGCRDQQGSVVFYDLCENIHEQGILRTTMNRPSDPIRPLAVKYLTAIMNALDYVGLCTAEFFQVGDQLMVNELAPRVHNTGHWTIEGALSSQFENHCRAILGLPLGATQSRGSFTMKNYIGELPQAVDVISKPGHHFHDYQKSPRPNRKVGHVTIEASGNSEQ